MNVPNKNSIDKHYSEKWASGEWSHCQPNEDEILRLNAIKIALAKHVNYGIQENHKPLLIDVGCGRGWLSSSLSGSFTTTGIDPVSEAINTARDLYPSLAFDVATPEELTDEYAGYYDVLVSSEVIEHIPYGEQQSFLESCKHLLKPQGIAVFTTPRKYYLDYCVRVNRATQPIEDWLSDDDFAMLAKKAGFGIIEQSRIWKPGYVFSRYTRILSHPFTERMSASIAGPMIRSARRHMGIYQLLICKNQS